MTGLFGALAYYVRCDSEGNRTFACGLTLKLLQRETAGDRGGMASTTSGGRHADVRHNHVPIASRLPSAWTISLRL